MTVAFGRRINSVASVRRIATRCRAPLHNATLLSRSVIQAVPRRVAGYSLRPFGRPSTASRRVATWLASAARVYETRLPLPWPAPPLREPASASPSRIVLTQPGVPAKVWSTSVLPFAQTALVASTTPIALVSPRLDRRHGWYVSVTGRNKYGTWLAFQREMAERGLATEEDQDQRGMYLDYPRNRKEAYAMMRRCEDDKGWILEYHFHS